MKINLIILLSIASVGYSIPVVLIDEPQYDAIDLSSLGPGLFSDPDESVGRAVNDWLPEHGVNPEELGTYLEGDILMPGIEGRNGLVKTSSRWPNGVVPYVISSSFSSNDRSTIMMAIAEYHSKTCIRFVPRTNQQDYVYFESTNTGCWSSVGKVGKKQTINLQANGCTRMGTILHECMHAIGFLHEQNRYDRDGYVRVLTKNIKPETLTNFEKAQAGETTEFGVAYNTGSVMHYSATAFSRNGQKTIEALRGGQDMGQRAGFASSDIEKINKMYQCNNIRPPSPSINRPTIERPTVQRPSAGSVGGSGGSGAGLTNPLAVALHNIGSALNWMAGKPSQDENETNSIDK